MYYFGNEWDEILADEWHKEYYQNLRKFLFKEYRTKTIYPHMNNIFNALKAVSFSDVKVVILGQDPYHNPGQAHGFAFSVQPGLPAPPSLQNIYKELHDDIGFQIPNHGYLMKWADEGVLLLNTVLTVRKQPELPSREGLGDFTDRIISSLNNHNQPIVFLLWGRNARDKEKLIHNKNFLILRALILHHYPLIGDFLAVNISRKLMTFYKKRDERLLIGNWTSIMKHEAKESGMRLDKYLSIHFGSYSRSQWEKKIEDQEVLVNGHTVKKNYVLNPEDVIQFSFSEKRDSFVPEEGPLDIVYEDAYLALVNKERNMTVYPNDSVKTGTLAQRLPYHFASLSTLGGTMRPGIVHRLDRDTTGLMIIAKDNQTHEKLNTLMQLHHIERLYLAIVYGNFKASTGEISIPLGRIAISRWRMSEHSDKLREAVSQYRVLEQNANGALIEVRLITGRTHQIRAHLEAIGHPILGDPVYQDGINPTWKNLPGQMLHCYNIIFNHPMTEEKLILLVHRTLYF